MTTTVQKLMVEVGADTTDVNHKLNDLGDENGGGAWAKNLTKIGVAAFAAIGAAAVGAVGYGVSIASDMEQADIGFTKMLGSAEASKAFMGELSAFAAKTPFELPGLTAAASKFVGAGVEADKVIPILTSVGDAVSAVGGNQENIDAATRALVQMQTKGKVTGEEMLQLVEAGVPAWGALAETLGTDVAGAQKMVSDGAVPVDKLYESIASKAGPLGDVAGMMDLQSQSLAGLWATFKDTMGMGLADMSAPIVESIKGMLPDLSAAMGDLMKDIGPPLSEAIGGLLEIFKEILPVLKPIITTVAHVFAGVMTALGPVLAALAPVIGDIAVAFGNVLMALTPLIAPIGLLLASVMPLIPVLLNLATSIISALMPAFIPLIGALVQLVEKLVPVITEMFSGPMLDAILKIAEALVELVLALLPLLPPLTELLLMILPPLAEFIALNAEAIAWLIRAFSDIIAPIARVVASFANIKQVGGTMLQWFKDLPGNVLGAIGSIGSKMGDVGKDIVYGIWNGLVDMSQWLWDKIWKWIKNVIPGPVKIALGISSPSKVMAELGAFAGKGLALGILDSQGIVARAAASLAESAQVGISPVNLAMSGSGMTVGALASTGSAQRGPTTVIYQTVEGNVWTENELIDKARNKLIRTGNDNGGGALGGVA